jgi:hypothetical protein
MALEVPTSSENKVLQDRYNRQLAETIENLKVYIQELEQRLVALGG